MISIEEALKAVELNTKELSKGIKMPLETAVNSILFLNVFSPINMPPFRQSAMDGYAINLHNDLTYSLVGEVKAGDSHHPKLKRGEAVRIFTGAAVPDSANAVVMQEKVIVNSKVITIESSLQEEHNIRQIGEQVKKGELALKKGTKLIPAAIGYLSSLGIEEVWVYESPSIAIVTTGNELAEAGEPLIYGKVYESNSKMLQSALINLGFFNVSIHKIIDDYNSTLSKLNAVIEENDLVIISGGISVGDYDFVGKALKQLQVEEIFYKVNQKPGKPLFFGKKRNALIFALPGNPAAALTCFYMYVLVALQKLIGFETKGLVKVLAKSTSNFEKVGDRSLLLKAYYEAGKVTVLEGQSSAMLQTFAVSNAIVKMSDDLDKINKDDVIEVMLLPV